MLKEYKLTIQSIGGSPEEAIESGIRMLNKGASFDEITCVSERYETVKADEPEH